MLHCDDTLRLYIKMLHWCVIFMCHLRYNLRKVSSLMFHLNVCVSKLHSRQNMWFLRHLRNIENLSPNLFSCNNWRHRAVHSLPPGGAGQEQGPVCPHRIRRDRYGSDPPARRYIHGNHNLAHPRCRHLLRGVRIPDQADEKILFRLDDINKIHGNIKFRMSTQSQQMSRDVIVMRKPWALS